MDIKQLRPPIKKTALFFFTTLTSLIGLASEPVGPNLNVFLQANVIAPHSPKQNQTQIRLADAQHTYAQTQTEQDLAEADALNYTLNNRKNIDHWLDNDPDFQALAQRDPHYAQALRLGYKVFQQTGSTKLIKEAQRQALMSEAYQAIPPDSQGLDLQNRLVSIASGEIYEPYRNIAETGYVMNRATGNIRPGNPTIVDSFHKTQKAQINLKLALAQKAKTEVSSSLNQEELEIELKRVEINYKRALLESRQQRLKAQQEKLHQDLAGKKTDLLLADNALFYIDKLLQNKKGLDGITGAFLSKRPTWLMTDAQRNAMANLDTMKSQIALNVIRNLQKDSAMGLANFASMNAKQIQERIDRELSDLTRGVSTDYFIYILQLYQKDFQRMRRNLLEGIARLKAKVT